jgi:maltooligosyltrehalose trehalohydrolase
MLFMGEEYGEKAPFQYFTSHSDEALIEAVRKGRREEFDDFEWEGEAPDPHDIETFRRSKLNRDLLERDEHASIHRLYKQLLGLRRSSAALRTLDLSSLESWSDDARRVVLIRRSSGAEKALVGFNFSDKAQRVTIPFGHDDAWEAMMDTGAKIEGSSLTLAAVGFAVFSG